MNSITCVWSRKPLKGGVSEKCVINDKGDYVGIETGTLYSKEEYYHSEIVWAKVVGIDESQQNGMIHLDPNDKYGIECVNVKRNFIGCTMPFRQAHSYGDYKVYYSIWTSEYFNDLEIEIIS